MGDQGGQYLPGDHYPTIVVGSGFGGAVAACRLSQAGLPVAILERGRRWPPGSFPHRLGKLGSGWWWGHRHGLYDVSPLSDMLCVRAAGWGGGSLLYANVVMRPAPEVFEQDWPQPYRRAELDPYFDLAAHMLEVSPVPVDPESGRVPAKTAVMAEAGRRWGDDTPLFHPNLAIRFADDRAHPGTNAFGIPQGTCVGCGRCDIGCNYGAKNTLDLNYLALAERHGATVATLTEVTHLSRAGDRYVLHLHQLGDAEVERRTVTADRVILAAGALGSTEILLRSRAAGTLPDLPADLGCGYSANGDFLAFGDGTADLVSPGTGPTITTAYGLRTHDGHEFLVEDGGYPNEISLFLGGRPLRRSGAAGHDTVLLAMGRDRSDGRLRLTRRGRLHLDWDTAANRRLYDAAQRVCADVVEALGGRGTSTFLWRWFRRPVSVHHLGGCRMSADPTTGVVDLDGQVFGHAELYVWDGAIIPAATGANPSHTITAVAERCVERLIRRLLNDPGWVAPERTDVRPIEVPEDTVRYLDLPARDEPGVSFRETMRGTVRIGTDEIATAFAITAHADDLNAFLTDRHHRLRVTGRIIAPPLTPASGAAIESGTLDLLARIGPGRRTMTYALPFRDLDGRPRTLTGNKAVWHQHGLDLWSATTTLPVTLTGEHTDEGAGVLRLSPRGVAAGLLSFRPLRAPTPVAAATQLGRFLGFFADRLGRQFVPGWPRSSRIERLSSRHR